MLPAGCAHRWARPIVKVPTLQNLVIACARTGGEQQGSEGSITGMDRLPGSLWALSQALAPAGEGFGVGHTRNTQTKGVWLWGQPQAVTLPADQPGSPPQQVSSGLTLHSPWALLLHAMLKHQTHQCWDRRQAGGQPQQCAGQPP